MTTVANVAVALVALLHVYFLVLEMFLWDKPRGLRTFGLTPEFASASKALAANQGLYNGFLAAGRLWGLALGDTRDSIKGLATIGLQSVMEDLAPRFEKASGHKVSITFGLGVAMVKRVQEGEAADLLLAPRSGIDALIKAGKVAPGSDTSLARSSVGIAVRKGAPKPDISTPDALKRALTAAKSISYSNPAFGGASGVHFAKVLERLGIAEEMKAKTKFPPEGGFTARLLAAGEAEMAVQQIGELISVPDRKSVV